VDEFDRAQLAEEQDRERALAALRADHRPGASREVCADCERAIPRERRKAVPGCTRCVDCQQIEDRRLARIGR